MAWIALRNRFRSACLSIRASARIDGDGGGASHRESICLGASAAHARVDRPGDDGLDGLGPQLGRVGPREVEQVADDAVEALGLLAEDVRRPARRRSA